MSQESEEDKTTEFVTNTNGSRRLGLKLRKKDTTKKSRATESRSELDKQDVVLLHMIVSVDVSK